MRRLEARGKPAKAVALLVRELGATQRFTTPAGKLTVPDHRRQMAAVEVAGRLLGPNG